MNIPRRQFVWKTARREFDLGARPLLMAIINVTPDSFSDGGEYMEMESAIAHAEQALEHGADILDIGGESTRPGSARVSDEEEIARVVPLVEDLAKRFDAPISVDTSKRSVAKRVLDAGAEIINDISGLRFEPEVAEVVAERKAGIVLMHSRGAFEEMHVLEPLEDIFSEVVEGIGEGVAKCRAAGIEAERICVDPGIGFGKTLEQNLELIGSLAALKEALDGMPMLVGLSRKSFIGKVLGDVPVSHRLNGTIASNAIALMNGADIIRVHDVRPNRDLIDIYAAICRSDLEHEK